MIFFPPAESYVKHPNSYLPKYNVQSETDGETTPLNANSKNRDSGGSNTFESEEELDDHIEPDGKCLARKYIFSETKCS